MPSNPPPLTRRRPNPRRRGFSLLEILVVLAIVALIAGVIAVPLLRHLEEARITTSRESARTLRSAVTAYRMDHEDCPTMETLVAGQFVDSASRTTDAWERPFVIQCSESSETVIVSGGPDKKIGTEDDIRVPAPPPRVPRASAEP